MSSIRQKVFKVKFINNNMFGWLFRKKEIEKLKDETKKGFDSVKKDINSIGGWINYLDSEKNVQKRDVGDLKEELSSIKKEIEGIKNIISFMGEMKMKQGVQTANSLSKKQTGVEAVQTGVQTGVQTPFFAQFSTTEKAIIWVLLNSELKLSYDDIAAMLGKERSTIRGQISSIKQKSEGLLKEIFENNGKKRVYIPEEIKEKLLKKAKVRVDKDKKEKKKKKEQVSEY